MAYSQGSGRVVTGHEIYSAHLGEERTIKVCLPPGYDASLSYPVLYCHDGSEFFTHGRIATIATDLIVKREIAPIVIVGIAVNKARRTDDYALGGVRNDAYIRFALEEAIPLVEERYSVAHETGRRLMAGISLSSVVSLEIALRYPEEFSRLCLFSGAYYPNVQKRVDEQTNLSHVAAFMVVGEDETAVETPMGTSDFLAFNRVMRDTLRTRGADVTYGEAPGQHLWGFWQSQMQRALRWVDATVAAE